MTKKDKSQNILDYIPVKNKTVKWEIDENGQVTIHMENKGLFAQIAQKVFHKPRYSKIKLEEFGNHIWPMIDGEHTIYELAQSVKETFGERAEPLYDRLIPYFQTLHGHQFIDWKQPEK